MLHPKTVSAPAYALSVHMPLCPAFVACAGVLASVLVWLCGLLVQDMSKRSILATNTFMLRAPGPLWSV